ncbi:uncharacterized protein LOC142179961 [Nicotiana tabacum]|uniref:Uncharacterized protein LOC142179961 n=1 Tax=Nicotiana tabacum TaxID=4097 RepID=A0AC58UBV3_TOBAC
MVINILVNSPRGSVFLESYDASDSSTDSNKIFNLFEKTILIVEKENVVQVVTDNASENTKAGDMLKGVFSNFFWTPCAAHCINLMFGDIFKLAPYSTVFAKSIKIHSYISQRPLLLNMMSRYTNERNLSESIYAKEALLKEVARFIVGPYFWNDTVQALKVSNPLVTVLRLVDGERKPPMGYIYEAMDRAKEAIEKAFDHDRRKYGRVFEIIDERWMDQLYQPLHAAGHILNLEFFYTNNEKKTLDVEVWKGYHACVAKLVPDEAMQDKIGEELGVYMQADGILGLASAIRGRTKLAPAPKKHEEEEVYEGEGLTFGHVAMESGVEENVYGFRGSTLRSKERVSTSTSRTLIDKASDEEEEEDDDQYNNSNMMTLQEFGDLVEE